MTDLAAELVDAADWREQCARAHSQARTAENTAENELNKADQKLEAATAALIKRVEWVNR